MTAYEAIVNLSVPRAGDPGKETDLVFAGETIELTDDQADLFRPPFKAVAMIRPAKEGGERPRILPRQLSGIQINRRTGLIVGVPGPGVDTRPDPEGSSQVITTGPPEANEPQPGSETGKPSEDAVDIPPRARRGPPSRAGARS
jgi:hypothetical protein